MNGEEHGMADSASGQYLKEQTLNLPQSVLDIILEALSPLARTYAYLKYLMVGSLIFFLVGDSERLGKRCSLRSFCLTRSLRIELITAQKPNI